LEKQEMIVNDQKDFFYISLYRAVRNAIVLVVFGSLFVGCDGLSTTQTVLPQGTTPSTNNTVETSTVFDTPTKEAGQTSIPVSDVTNLPKHAPTITPDENASGGQLFPETQETAAIEEAPVDLSSLVDSDDIFPGGEIKIFRPGPYSLVSSPVHVTANLAPGQNDEVHLRLVGEDGRTLAQYTVKVYPYVGATTHTMGMDIFFDIQVMSELGRLEISVIDEFGRPRAMNSVNLILLSTGTSKRNYGGDLLEEVVINYPTSNLMVQGNLLLVSGLVRTRSEEPLKLELIDETGTVIGSADAAVLLLEDNEHGIFAGEIEYTVTTPTWVRLVIRVPGERIPGMVYIKTMEVLIGP
jgi:hypothetical protein